MTGTQLWLARHGETEWSATGRHTGTTDIPLDPTGRAAAKRLGELLADQDFELVLTSPLSRARDTCALAGFGDEAIDDPDLVEWDYGDYEGVTTDEIRRQHPGWTVFTGSCPGGETIESVAARADRVLDRVRRDARHALVFGHGHALRVLAARWLDLPPQVGANLVLETATISVLDWDRETPAILRWNAG